MSGFIQKAIEEVRFEIPEEILDYVFMKKAYWERDRATNIDREIINKVICPRILVDFSLSGGTDYLVPLLDIHREVTEEFMAVYTIPKEFVANRSIVSILSVMYLNPYMVSNPASITQCGWSSTLAAGQAVMDAMSPIPNFTSAEVQLGGENVIVIRDARVLPERSYARVTLAYDEYLSDINPKYYIALATAVRLAVQAYIWRKTRIELDKGKLSGGVELSEFKNVIEEYRDSNENYRDYIKNTVRKLLFMNDDVKRRRQITSHVGGYR